MLTFDTFPQTYCLCVCAHSENCIHLRNPENHIGTCYMGQCPAASLRLAEELAQVQKSIEGYRVWQNARTTKVVLSLIEQRKKLGPMGNDR